MKQCPNCKHYVDDSSAFCNHCGYSFVNVNVHNPQPTTDNLFDASGPEGKSRGVAALLAIFLGYLGIQYFYLGKISAGILTIVLTLVTCGVWDVINIIQGILMFCMTNAQFRTKYVINPATFPVF